MSRKLKRAFLSFNRRYFNGRLPKETEVKYSKKIFRKHHFLGHAIYLKNALSLIRIAKELKRTPTIAQLVLLHEMCHIALMQQGRFLENHGTRFQKLMLKLAKKGAFKDLW